MAEAERRTSLLTWTGLSKKHIFFFKLLLSGRNIVVIIKHAILIPFINEALMGVQFGVLARLTWWEYSWDIMEPITYFVTYGTSIAAFAYYVLTKQVSLHFPVSRVFLFLFVAGVAFVQSDPVVLPLEADTLEIEMS